MHDSIYYLLVAGGLTALNKVSEEEQTALIRKTGSRKLQPVNSGSAILKAPMRCGLDHPAAQRAMDDMRPIQMGMGMPSRPQAKVMLARLLVEEGHYASLQDAINAFHALHRQAALDAVGELWNEGLPLFWKIYGQDAPCLYAYTDAAGLSRVGVLLSKQGVRMGCVFGSCVFCLTMHLFVFRILRGPPRPYEGASTHGRPVHLRQTGRPVRP